MRCRDRKDAPARVGRPLGPVTPITPIQHRSNPGIVLDFPQPFVRGLEKLSISGPGTIPDFGDPTNKGACAVCYGSIEASETALEQPAADTPQDDTPRTSTRRQSNARPTPRPVLAASNGGKLPGSQSSPYPKNMPSVNRVLQMCSGLL